MKSRDSSRLKVSGGLNRLVISAVDDRMLVSFFSLHTLIGISSLRACVPTIIPSYTEVPGSMNVSPRPWALISPYVTAVPFSEATSTPLVESFTSPVIGL